MAIGLNAFICNVVNEMIAAVVINGICIDTKLFICFVVNANNWLVNNIGNCADDKLDMTVGLKACICNVVNELIEDVVINGICIDTKLFI